MAKPKVNFATFFSVWAEEMRWNVPDIHWMAVHWLEHRGKLAVLRCFRGFGKSTLLALYNAWRYYQDPSYRILHQGDQDKTAYKTSRDTKSVLMRHPLTRDKFQAIRGEASFWWVPGSVDERNPSMQAAGITSTITSSRCDEAQNDDVEVPRNIQNPEAREKMRYRLGEQTHCMVPGARQLFIGTPHTHDSLYDEMEAMGADCLTIPMFTHERRIDTASALEYTLDFVPEIVLSGIGKFTKALKPGKDYELRGTKVILTKAPGGMLDFYAGSAWQERFTLEEMETRRKKCRTINEWDSQYQLHSRPLHQVRLDPSRIIPYDVQPKITQSNGGVSMWLGNARIAGASLRWDPASGKLTSDVSALALVLQDDGGRRYLHHVQQLSGEVAEFAPDGKQITGGQVLQICNLVKSLSLPRVSVETNGIGTFAPAVLKACFKQNRVLCGVSEVVSTTNKNKRILEELEPLLMSRGMLWAHVDVLKGPLWDQMKDWNPAHTNQADDYLDATAGAVSETPERISRSDGWIPPSTAAHDWRPSAGEYEVSLEH